MAAVVASALDVQILIFCNKSHLVKLRKSYMVSKIECIWEQIKIRLKTIEIGN